MSGMDERVFGGPWRESWRSTFATFAACALFMVGMYVLFMDVIPWAVSFLPWGPWSLTPVVG